MGLFSRINPLARLRRRQAGVNPLSLSVPQSYLDQWAREVPSAAGPRARWGGGGNSGGGVRTLADLTVDDLIQPPRRWREFLALDRMSDAYGVVPGPPLSRAFLLDTHARLTANVFTFIGNYLRLGLVLVLCVLYKQPLALVGMVLTAKAWDWLRSASASMDTTAPPYRALYAAVTILTWIVLVVSKVTVVLLLAALISVATVCVHGVLRKPGYGAGGGG